ncbi:MAG: signal peptidase I [Candidatus Korarchaeota archaeon]|nr:signal peptidase I [Candidatus Korarchaeota archaeon]
MPADEANKWLTKEILTLAVLFLIFLAFFKVVLPLLTGVDSPFTVVTSGSMRPTLEVGDLLIVVGADPYNLKVGDIIVFRVPWSSSLIVHRIIRIDMSMNGPVFYTKGDNNALPDPGFRTSRDIYGKVVLRIPYLGSALELLQSLPAKLAIVGIIAAYLLYEYSKVLGKESTDNEPYELYTTEQDDKWEET